MAEEKETIFFTKRITKSGGALIIAVPTTEKDFEYQDQVKVTLLRKASPDDKDEGGGEEKQNNNKKM